MDGHDVPFDTVSPDGILAIDETAVEQTSAEYLGRWNRLVSTTNWEKGRIISQWRQSLLAAGTPIQSCSDEAWSRRVGNVSPQHVGRLRRTCEQFGQVYEQYRGLFWSHFQAVLDWEDAEMWLEGAVQNGWSVAEMRRQRWQATGGMAAEEPQDVEADAAETDEDAVPEEGPPDTIRASQGEVRGADGEDSRDDDGESAEGDEPPFEPAESLDPVADAEPVRPFEHLPAMPDDLHDAFESFKLAILRHKVAGWREIARDDLLAVLDGLKQLALAPADV